VTTFKFDIYLLSLNTEMKKKIIIYKYFCQKTDSRILAYFLGLHSKTKRAINNDTK